MARECDKEEGQEEEDDDDGEVEEEVINGKRNQHYNKNSNNKNGHNAAAACDSTSTHSCPKGPSKSPLNNPQRSKTTKYTQHKWDTELSRRKLLLLYYLVRGRTFNRYNTHSTHNTHNTQPFQLALSCTFSEMKIECFFFFEIRFQIKIPCTFHFARINFFVFLLPKKLQFINNCDYLGLVD